MIVTALDHPSLLLLIRLAIWSREKRTKNSLTFRQNGCLAAHYNHLYHLYHSLSIISLSIYVRMYVCILYIQMNSFLGQRCGSMVEHSPSMINLKLSLQNKINKDPLYNCYGLTRVIIEQSKQSILNTAVMHRCPFLSLETFPVTK